MPLKKFRILIADSDMQLASVSKLMLKGMGFQNIEITSNGRNALGMVKTGAFDFVITDWNLADLDGITLIDRIRRDPDSPNPTLPVIMLTGRMEETDVHLARDKGTHEYVIKPFTAQSIYSRLERIVDFPRYFVIGSRFVGPDRRHRTASIPQANRRTEALLPQRRPTDAASAIQQAVTPNIWMPDYTLKHKLGRDVTLDTIITPARIGEAQAAIHSATDASRGWIKEDVRKLRALCAELALPGPRPDLVADIGEVALMVSSRSGTFGLKHASTVAYMLYLFTRKVLVPSNPVHRLVLEKHVDVLQVIFAKNIQGDDKSIPQIVKELTNLAAKCS